MACLVQVQFLYRVKGARECKKQLGLQRKHVRKEKAGLIKNGRNVEQTLMKAAADTLHMPPNM